MAIYGVNVAFNVEADSQEQAAQKMADHLSENLRGEYESIEEPILQATLRTVDCDTLIY